MPPKDIAKKSAPTVIRPPISSSSLLYVPEDAVEGYQDRIESGIEWVLLEHGARHHKKQCQRDDIRAVTFHEGLQNKISKSILNGFFDESSQLSLQEQWEFLIPITVWDNKMFASEEGKICFTDANNVTDDLMKLIKKAVYLNDRQIIKKELMSVSVLRVNNCEITDLDEKLKEFKKLVSLSLCGNYIKDIKHKFIPPSLKSIELQGNFIRNLEDFASHLPSSLLYIGLARNVLTNDNINGLNRMPHSLTVLDLSDNDIYSLVPVLEALSALPSLMSLILAGNPCAMCAAYARTTISQLPKLQWLDNREILTTDRHLEMFEPHPDDLRSAYFSFTVFRVMSVIQPPKPEKGAVTTFHVELELPLLDHIRRSFLMYRGNESLVEIQPPAEDEDDLIELSSKYFATSKSVIDPEASSHASEIYNHLVPKNSKEVLHYTVFESSKIQWSKMMNFQEPTVKIFCPDLVALRDTFRSVITVRLVYTMTVTAKPAKEKKSITTLKLPPGEQRLVLATIKCQLKRPDWSQPSQHFHWDDSLMTDQALHWGDGDLSVLQYNQAPSKAAKGKAEGQMPPDNLTCHFGFGIDTIRN